MFKKPQVSLEQKYDTLPLEQQKKDILENFDFAIVASIMAIPCKPVYKWDVTQSNTAEESCEIVGYEPWKMYIRTDEYKVPNEGELRFLAIRLLDDVIKCAKSGGNYHTIATGPFKAIYRYGILELDFVMETWSCD